MWAMPQDIREVFEAWSQIDFKGLKKKKWNALFFAVVWSLWKHRNKIIF